MRLDQLECIGVGFLNIDIHTHTEGERRRWFRDVYTATHSPSNPHIKLTLLTRAWSIVDPMYALGSVSLDHGFWYRDLVGRLTMLI